MTESFDHVRGTVGREGAGAHGLLPALPGDDVKEALRALPVIVNRSGGTREGRPRRPAEAPLVPCLPAVAASVRAVSRTGNRQS
jgi:hypothetical protein